MANQNLKLIIQAIDQFSGTFRNLNSQLGGVKSSLTSLNGALAAVGVSIGAAFAVRTATEMMRMAASADAIEQSFVSLAKASGMSADALLGNLRRVSRGTVTEAELMKTANLALQAGGAELASSLPRLFEVARAAAVSSGQDVTYIFDTLVRGIVRGSPLLIDNANIFVKVGQAVSEYADKLGKSEEELTANEKQMALLNAVLADSERFINNVGSAALTTAEKMGQMRVAADELKTAWGKLLNESPTVQNRTGWATGVLIEFRVLDEYRQLYGILPALATGFGKTGSAMDELRTRLQEGEITANEYEDALRRLLGLLGTMAPGYGIPQIRAAGNSALLNAPSATMFGGSPAQYGYGGKTIAQQQQVVTDYLDRQADAERRKAESLRLYNSRLQEEQALLDGIRSRAESILTAGTNVTQQDVLDTQAGRYVDKPLEAARRLADIANRGMESPWAKILIPPPEIVAQGDAAVKAWASRVQQDVVDLTRPDLVNWDAFIANYRDSLAREAAKETTLNIAMQKLGEAGLLGGVSPGDAKSTVAKMLGMSSPATEAETFASGFAEAIGQKDLANLFLGSFDADVSNNKDTIRKSGASLGGVIIDGVNTGVRDNMGSVRKTIAYYIAPEVAAILAEKDGAKP